jgi:hypothetical protein
VSLFSGISDAAAWMRDASIQELLWQLVISKKTKAIKNMRNLEINSKQKNASLKLELDGESEPLEIKIGGYQFFENDGKLSIELSNIHTSKKWLTILAAEFLEGKRFEISSNKNANSIIRKFL